MFRKIMLLVVLVPFLFPTARTAWAATTFNPYRVLLVIGDQWNDPASFVVDVPSPHPPHNDHTVRPLGTDFMQLVVMLKSWCVPFDILRLDQEIMNINHFLGSDNKPLYGCILWAADPRADGLRKQSYGVLKEAVEQYGISLVALSNRICHPVLEDLLGLRYLGYNMTHDKITLNEGCCIVQGMGKVIVDIGPSRYQHRAVAEVTAKEVAGEEMGVIAMQGKHPALTHRKIRVGLKTFWIGGDVGLMFEHQNIRTILRRMIVNAVGYGLHKSWEKRYIIAMDDPGGAQSCYLDHWSYPTLTREQIRERMIAPLKKHGAMMVINVVPGFVNEQK
ncbi:MAG: hypothetical protein U9P14_05555, partial [Gemmatimonadota bacterium]|nr:hypothetical protein [Gemmatimonadota bacterium]